VSRRSLAKPAIQWMEHRLIHGEGDVFGEPYRLLPWHKNFLHNWYIWDDTLKQWWFQQACVGAESGASKTEFFAAVAVFELAAARTGEYGWDRLPIEFRRKTPIVTMAAASRDQAGELFRQGQAMCGGEEGARTAHRLGRDLFHVFANTIEFKDGAPGRIQRVAAKDSTSEGGKESLLLGDEIHEWHGKIARVWTVRAKSLTKRMGNPGRAIGMSTAGLGRGSMPPKDDDSLLWRLYAHGLLAQDDPTSRFLLDWVQPPDDIIYARKNPERIYEALRGMRAADQTWSVDQRAQEIITGKIPWPEALRYYFNLFVNLTVESWLNEMPGVWEECQDTDAAPRDGQDVVVGVDMALSHDSVGLVVAGFLPDGRIGWWHRHYPPIDGRIDHVSVFNYIVDIIATRWRVKAITYDPRFFELPARMIEDHGFLVVEFKQSVERLVVADGLLYELVRSHKLAHLGDSVLNTHAVNAAWRWAEGGRYLSKGKSVGHMDLIRAGSMASYELMSHLNHDPIAIAV
jgi:phage terminase large subunit-like protein